METLVTTKHGHKARNVTPEQEAALDQIAAERFSDPISKINVLNDQFGNTVIVYTTNGEMDTPAYLVSAAGDTYPM